MPILKNTARQITLSVRLSGATDGPYVAATWPNDAVAQMWYSKDGGTPVAVIPTRISATTGGWLLSVATMTASVWNCDELRVFWEGTGILSGTQTYYPEADYTSTVAGRIDASVSSRSTLTAADVWASGTRTLTSFGTLVADTAAAVWAAATRTLTAISDSAGITTLLSRLTNTRAGNLDNLTVVPLDAAGTRTALGLAADNLDTQLSAINSKTTNLPASPAAVGSAMTLANNSVTAAALASDAVAEIVDGVWDEALSGHTTAGSAGKALADAGSSITPLTTALRYGTMLCTYSEPGSVLSDFAVNVGEDTWIESKVVDEDGSPIPLDGYTLTATLTASGGFTEALDNTEVQKIVDEDGVNIDGRFRWRAYTPLTTTARRNVRFTLLLSGGSGNVRTALARVQVEG